MKAGQLLAEIDTSPTSTSRCMQARANLATAQANQRLSAITAKRWEGLVAQDAVSRQEADEKTGDLRRPQFGGQRAPRPTSTA